MASVFIGAAGAALSDPTVPGFTVETYAANAPHLLGCLSFDSSGNLYVGTDAYSSRIYRVPPGGGAFEEYGDTILDDPDTVTVDLTGAISGMPDSVLVGGQTTTLGQGYVVAIWPDQSTHYIWPQTPTFANPADFAFCSGERLVFPDIGLVPHRVFVYDPDADPAGPPPTVDPTTLIYSVDPAVYTIAVGAQDWIFLGHYYGSVSIHDCDGTLVNSSFADGLGAGSVPLAVGPGGIWGSDLYAMNPVDGELWRFEVLADGNVGNSEQIGWGFDGYPCDIEFGPDGALYMSFHTGRNVLRIAPEPTTCESDELVKLLASDGVSGDVFGMWVAIENDTAVIGAPADPQRPGCAYVFERECDGWTQRAKLWASDGAPWDQFGESVAISGDTIMIGAHLDDDSGLNAGAVYVFERPTDGWYDMTQTCKLLPNDGQPGDIFGYLALCGDTAVIGAPYDDDYAPEAGCAYVFERESGCWTQVAKLWASDAEQFAAFGSSVAIRGDTIAIGAPTGGADSSRPGSAYVFEKPSDGWADTNDETAILTPSDGQPCDSFGTVVAVSADGSVILIGACGDDNEYGVNAGAAYVFERPPGGWVDVAENHKITNAPDGQAYAFFSDGLSLSANGETALIGAYDHDGCGANSGAAYVFRFDGLTWNKEAVLAASDCAAGDRLGYQAALSGDTVLVGAFMDDNENGVDAGAAYVFSGISDCNENGALDICEMAEDPLADIDGNGILDECENQPPVCDMGGPYGAECGGPTTTMPLDGAGSYDPDAGDTLTFAWSTDCPGGVFDDETSPTPLLTIDAEAPCPLICNVTLTVTDDHGEYDTCSSTVTVEDTTPPDISTPAAGISVECDGAGNIDDLNTWLTCTGGAVATEACGSVTWGNDFTALSDGCGDTGSATVTFTATDDCGLTTTTTATFVITDTTPPDLVVPVDLTVECDGSGNTAELGTWLASASATDTCGNVTLSHNFAGLSDDCGATGSATVTWTAIDECGNPNSDVAAFTIADTTPPTLDVDTTPIEAWDADCSGDEPVDLRVAAATDQCGDVSVENDAPPTFPAGETTTVTFTATDACGRTTSEQVDVTVWYGADIEVHAARHTVGAGSYPGSTKEPLVGIEVCAYDKSEGSCARVECGGISHQHYQCIVDTCEPINCATTDEYGVALLNLPPGDYIIISDDATKTVLPDPLGVSASDLACGEVMVKHLQQIVRADGVKLPGKTQRLTGSELLIIEPEYILWGDIEQLYPFVFESIGDWGVTATVAPPEGFVTDYESLSEDVYYEIEAVQFTITEIGSDLVPTVTTFDVIHNGERRVVPSSVGIQLTSEYAQSRGFDVEELRARGLIKEKNVEFAPVSEKRGN